LWSRFLFFGFVFGQRLIRRAYSRVRVYRLSAEPSKLAVLAVSPSWNLVSADEREGPIGLSEENAVPWFGRTKRRVVDDHRERERFSSAVAEFVLGKRRILEIYLNVVEWGPGIYGAESACHYYDGTTARNVDRQQAARLAAIVPAPLKRRPERMNNYSVLIVDPMRQVNS
jgi:hypothetical protein